jgi:hypothetical protein
VGDTFPIRAALKSAGCRWDADEKAWWTGKRETAESLVAQASAGQVQAYASYVKLADGSWGVRLPSSMPATLGQQVTVETKGGKRKQETIAAVVETDERGTICAVVQAARAPRLPSKVGETGAYSSEFEGSKHAREPGRQLGESCWLKHEGQRLAVVVVGYERAQWIPGDVLEDMSDYSHGGRGAWLGVIHYRAATAEEYAALQASQPRADGVCAP